MSPLITILVIMLLTVVYNESQYIADYQDVYQKPFKKNVMLLELCDSSSQRKLCEKSYYRRRQLLKENNDVIDFEDEDSNKYRDLINDEIAKNIGQKRNYGTKPDNNNNCQTVKTPVELGPGYFPNMLYNVSCLYTSGADVNGNRICLMGSNCQPVTHKARILTRRMPSDTVHVDIPPELKACWKFEYIQIHVGCKCARPSPY